MELNKEFFRGLNTEKFPVSDEQQTKSEKKIRSFLTFDEPVQVKVFGDYYQWHVTVRMDRNGHEFSCGDLYHEDLDELKSMVEKFDKGQRL